MVHPPIRGVCITVIKFTSRLFDLFAGRALLVSNWNDWCGRARLIAFTFHLSIYARFAVRAETIRATSIAIEELACCWQLLLASRTLLVSIRDLRFTHSISIVSACPTNVAQSVFCAIFAGMKVLGGRWVEVQTGNALLALWWYLGYDVTHDRSLLLLSSRQGMLEHRSGKTLLPLDYTTNPLCKPVYTLSYPLAIRTCRKETRCPR
jgi:hypothetical protein